MTPEHQSHAGLRSDVTLLWRRADESAAEKALEFLSSAEKERLARFRSRPAAVEYACGHALLREALSELASVDPPDWRFLVGEHGRPDVDPDQPGLPGHLRQLSVNLSHTRGLCLVGLSLRGELGVDTEWRERGNDLRRLARYKFAAAERRWLDEPSEEPEFRRRFFAIWTLKESYVKARGTGISIPLDGFAFHLEPERPPRISFVPDFDPDLERWHFGLLDHEALHQCAWALRTREPNAGTPSVEVEER